MIDRKIYQEIESALEKKEELRKSMRNICEYMGEISPKDNPWYYNDTGFLLVDVEKKDYDDYLKFIENMVGCSYCHLVNKTGLTLMINLPTILKKQQKE